MVLSDIIDIQVSRSIFIYLYTDSNENPCPFSRLESFFRVSVTVSLRPDPTVPRFSTRGNPVSIVYYY